MVKYAVVYIYGEEDGRMTGYSKPRKTYDTINEARVAAKRKCKMPNGANWVVRINRNNTATIMGQVWNMYHGWQYQDHNNGSEYVLNKDGSLGNPVDWGALISKYPDMYKNKKK